MYSDFVIPNNTFRSVDYECLRRSIYIGHDHYTPIQFFFLTRLSSEVKNTYLLIYFKLYTIVYARRQTYRGISYLYLFSATPKTYSMHGLYLSDLDSVISKIYSMQGVTSRLNNIICCVKSIFTVILTPAPSGAGVFISKIWVIIYCYVLKSKNFHSKLDFVY